MGISSRLMGRALLRPLLQARTESACIMYVVAEKGTAKEGAFDVDW